MTGSLPTQLGSLLNLKRLEIASNNFIGRPFDVLLNLTNLETLILDNSLFTGAIPESIDRLSNLQHLSLVDIQLTGSLPTALLTLKNLDHFAIFAKDLGGIFPENIDQLSNLGTCHACLKAVVLVDCLQGFRRLSQHLFISCRAAGPSRYISEWNHAKWYWRTDKAHDAYVCWDKYVGHCAY